MAKLNLLRKSQGPVGDVIWHYDEARRVRKAPSGYSASGKSEYFAEWHPHRGIFFTRVQPATSLADARKWLRVGYIPGREAITATGTRFIVPANGV